MRISLTGANGFLGTYVGSKLIADGHHVIAWIRDTAKSAYQDARFFDLGKAREIDLQDTDILVHCAAYLPPSFADDPNERKKCAIYNGLATYQLLEEAELANIKTFIYISSGQIYEPKLEKAKEDDNIYTDYRAKPYLRSKELGERNVMFHNKYSKMRIIILRPSSIYGNRMKDSGLLPRLIRRINAEEKFEIEEIGNYYVDLVCVEDVANMISIAVNNAAVSGVYNVGGGQPILTSHLVDTLCCLLNRPLPWGNPKKFEIEKGHAPLNIDKARNIGYKPITLIKGIMSYTKAIK